MFYKQRKYVVDLGIGDQKRIFFKTKKGKVTTFVAQYESKIDQRWTIIIRYDNAHGFAHRDEFYPDSRLKKKNDLKMTDLNQALTFASEDIDANWRHYKSLYLKRKYQYEEKWKKHHKVQKYLGY